MSEPPLVEALRAGDLAAVQKLVASGADLTVRAHNATTLHLAIPHGLAMVRVLVEAGVDIDQPTGPTMAPLSIALTVKAVDVAEYLLSLGASLTGRDFWGATPLHHAAVHGPPALIEALLARGADSTIKTTADMRIASPKKVLRKGATPAALATAMGRKWAPLLAGRSKPLPSSADGARKLERAFFGDEAAPPGLLAVWRAVLDGEDALYTEPYGFLRFPRAPSETPPRYNGSNQGGTGEAAEAEVLCIANAETHGDIALLRRAGQPWSEAVVVQRSVPPQLSVLAPSLEAYLVLRAWTEDLRKVGPHSKRLAKLAAARRFPPVTHTGAELEKAAIALAAQLESALPWADIAYEVLAPSTFATEQATGKRKKKTAD